MKKLLLATTAITTLTACVGTLNVSLESSKDDAKTALETAQVVVDAPDTAKVVVDASSATETTSDAAEDTAWVVSPPTIIAEPANLKPYAERRPLPNNLGTTITHELMPDSAFVFDHQVKRSDSTKKLLRKGFIVDSHVFHGDYSHEAFDPNQTHSATYSGKLSLYLSLPGLDMQQVKFNMDVEVDFDDNRLESYTHSGTNALEFSFNGEFTDQGVITGTTQFNKKYRSGDKTNKLPGTLIGVIGHNQIYGLFAADPYSGDGYTYAGGFKAQRVPTAEFE